MAPTPSAAACSSLCRSLVSTLWGVVVTVLAFSLDCWAQSSGWEMRYRVLILLSYPVYSEYEAVSNVLKVKLWEEVCRKLKKERIPATGCKDLKSYMIIASCKIWIYVPQDMTSRVMKMLKAHLIGEGNSLYAEGRVASTVQEALVVAGSPSKKHAKLHRLKRSATELQILIESGIITAPYDDLKYVMARSIVGTILAVVQAAGYLMGIILRLSQKRAVSPVEAIACYYGVLVLLHLITHALGLTCTPQRPLLIYLDSPTWDKLRPSIQRRLHDHGDESVEQANVNEAADQAHAHEAADVEQANVNEAADQAHAHEAADQAHVHGPSDQQAHVHEATDQAHVHEATDQAHVHEANPSGRCSFAAVAIAAVLVRVTMLCLIAASSIRYLKNSARCLLCGLAGLLFDLGLLLLVPALLTVDLNEVTPLASNRRKNLLFLSLLTIVSAFVVAVIATAREWDSIFRQPTIPLSQWIIPHIGS